MLLWTVKLIRKGVRKLSDTTSKFNSFTSFRLVWSRNLTGMSWDSSPATPRIPVARSCLMLPIGSNVAETFSLVIRLGIIVSTAPLFSGKSV